MSWQSWSDDLLERARAEQRPVLLTLVCSWGRCCEEMDARTWTDEGLADLVMSQCIPVRVDKDEHPDVDERYNRGGWPSTVLLDGAGEVLAGGTVLDPEPLAELVRWAATRCRGDAAGDVADEAPEIDAPGPAGSLDASISPAIERALLADFDERHGGFGTGQKFPHPEALDYALLRHAEFRNARLHEILEKTFTRMAEGELHDAVDGGFFRYCQRRDWSHPHTEKLLETNAGLARNYLEVGQLMGRADFLEIGERTIDVLLHHFLDEGQGLFHSGIDPDDDFYALEAASRRTRRPPACSGRFLADGNARAVSALLKAGAVFSRRDLTHRAVAVAEQLLRRLWRRGRGMYHFLDGTEPQFPGRLRDQAETARALLHVLQYTDDRRFVAPLEDLIEVLANDHVDANGEFMFQAGQSATQGVTRRDTRILAGAVAAEVLLRAAMYLGRPSLREIAIRSLELHATDFRRYGYAMAAYGRSVELVLHPPLQIVVVAKTGDRDGDALLRAASATYLPSRVVQRLDPDVDGERLEALALPVRDVPVAYVFRFGVCDGEHGSPDTLPQALTVANARRLQGR